MSGGDSAVGFPLPAAVDDAGERKQANRAVAVSAIGLTITGLIELAIAALTGSVGLLGDAFHNLSDVSTSALVFLGFRASFSATRSSPATSWSSDDASTPPHSWQTQSTPGSMRCPRQVRWSVWSRSPPD